ncbi:integrase [Mycolicibacterium canariasense]|uniref:Integrase n=1 Tax=Mycolicibacterium canariasense TaxID=228230 RepID=A0A100WCJ6_MYCCR|nr:site-specific integrase [Mycolicibacterium canariasense]MCV7212619.1 tyrosine-type recombinase/integrase [Mycolicibacterium canariasense]ORV02541.1 integrase [Mycolicibacterium canariasense]GAS95521.1 integrase [Mycolicibacterium canariasense]
MAKTTTSKRRAPGEGGLYKRKDGMWVGVVDIPTTDGSRRQKRVYSKDYGQARDKLDALKDNVSKGVIPSTTMTVGKWLSYWLTEVHGPHVRPKTYQFYEEAVRLHLTPAIGKKRLDRLTPIDVRSMLSTIATGRNKQRAHQVLSLALKAAVIDGMVERNVCEAVRKPKHLPAVRSAFTVDQARAIIRAAIDAEGDGPAVGTRWAAAFLTGARQAELLGLEWSRVDLDRGTADFSWQLQQLKKVHGCGDPTDGVYPCEVNRAKRQRAAYCPQSRWDFEDGFEYRECYKSLVWTRPKTRTGKRVVPLLPGLVEMLRTHAARQEPNPHGLVWHHPDGRPLSPTDDHEIWQQLLTAAGLTEPGMTIPMHSARHSTATMLQAAGVPEEVRMAIMGQSSVAAHAAYVHIDQTQTRAALTNLAELIA